MNKKEMQDAFDVTMSMFIHQAETDGLIAQDMEDFMRCILMAQVAQLKINGTHLAMAVAIGHLMLRGVQGPVKLIAAPEEEEPKGPTLH